MRSHQPIYWYPADEQASVLVIMPANDKQPYELIIDNGDGDVEYVVYENSGGTLGSILQSDQVVVGNEADWDIIAEANLGRVESFVNVPAMPSSGDWGYTPYRDVTSLIFEINRRMSYNSDTLTSHGNPILMIKREAVSGNQAGQGVHFGDEMQQLRGENADQYLLEIQSMRTRLDTLVESPVTILPPGYELKAMDANANMEWHFTQLDKSKEALYGATHLPLSLMGLDGSVKLPASGKALKFQFLDPHSFIQGVQANVVKSLKKVCMIGHCTMARLVVH